jgi:hypothetical protein
VRHTNPPITQWYKSVQVISPNARFFVPKISTWSRSKTYSKRGNFIFTLVQSTSCYLSSANACAYHRNYFQTSISPDEPLDLSTWELEGFQRKEGQEFPELGSTFRKNRSTVHCSDRTAESRGLWRTWDLPHFLKMVNWTLHEFASCLHFISKHLSPIILRPSECRCPEFMNTMKLPFHHQLERKWDKRLHEYAGCFLIY